MAMKKRKGTAKKSVAKRPKARAKAPVKKKAAPKKAKVMDQQACMEAWQKAATPAEGHRRLEPLAGMFRTKTTMQMDPSAPPDVTEGTSEHKWVLGGRYLHQSYKGTSMGMPFEGIGYTGYDNVQKKYVGTWMDCFGTGLMNSIGVGKPTDNLMEFESEVIDPMGQRQKFWSKVRVQDRDHHSYEMWCKAPNGRKFRMMLVEYARA